jgi:hypothetical protein
MKKRFSKKFPIPKLAIIGVILLALTPLVKQLLDAALTAPCGVIYGMKECGPDLNIRNASILEVAQGAWIAFGALILVTGIALYIKYRK